VKPQSWAQIKNITTDEFISALLKDEWSLRSGTGSSSRVFTKQGKVVSIHYHPHKTFGPSQLRQLLNDAGWAEGDLKRLKMIK
jgi:predicted RNA binding protein YcfA (HicA-like mRNA interferase family)